jgi:DNA-binding NtrC family response regulator
MPNEPILLVEDKAELREMLTHALTRMSLTPVAVAGVEEALQLLRKQRFAAVLTDLKLPTGTGFDVLRAALDEDAATPVIIMTAFGTITQAVEAMREGAFDFIQKPIDLNHLDHLLKRAIERQQLMRENVVLREEYARLHGFPRILGDHPSLRTAAQEMQRIAPTDSTVLLLGESGTGKELFARAVHQLSPRAQKPMVAVNCAAIPETLIENELFGHEKGAFTGADTRRAGKFELAHGGTIFLDEIGELPLTVQGKLLRVLEEKVVERLGGQGSVPVDVRIIAATNRELEAASNDGAFRKDLFYRLNVFPIRIPALRERGADVTVLAEAFLERFRRERNRPRLKFADSALSAMQQYSWPGNVRELQNVIERASILHDAEITASDLNLAPPASVSAASASLPDVAAQAAQTAERAKIEATLRDCKWNKAKTAERLGISYKTLLNKIHAYGLD